VLFSSLSVDATVSQLRIKSAATYIYIYIYIYKVKVKWFRYRPGVVQRVGRVITLLFHDRGTRRGWVVSNTPRPLFTPRKDPVPILQETGWATRPVWKGGKSRPHRIRSRAVQPLVSRYIEWSSRPTHTHTYVYIYAYIYMYIRHTSWWWATNVPETCRGWLTK